MTSPGVVQALTLLSKFSGSAPPRSLQELVDRASAAGYEIEADDLRQAFRHYWAMRWLKARAEGRIHAG